MAQLEQDGGPSFDLITHHLVENNWEGATVMFYFAEKRTSSPNDMLAYWGEEQLPTDTLTDTLKNLADDGLLTAENDVIALTERGNNLADLLLRAVPSKE